MGFFDKLTTILFSNKDQIMDETTTWIKQQGGISGILDKLNTGGLADTVQSWTNKNSDQSLPISSSQIQNLLGVNSIKELAQKVGLDIDSVSGLLSKFLPQIVSYLSNAGHDLSDISDNTLAEALNSLKDKFSL